MNSNYVAYGAYDNHVTIIGECSSCGKTHKEELEVYSSDDCLCINCPDTNEKIFLEYY